MRLIEINTTAFDEENFILLTDLSDDDLYEVIMPIVNAERDGEEFYENDDIVNALNKRYPNATIKRMELQTINY